MCACIYLYVYIDIMTVNNNQAAIRQMAQMKKGTSK